MTILRNILIVLSLISAANAASAGPAEMAPGLFIGSLEVLQY